MRRVSGLDYARAGFKPKKRASGKGGAAAASKAFARTEPNEALESWDSAISGSSYPASESRRTDHDRWLGTIVDNRYRVVEVIGRGGMGVVYRVEHLRMGKIAAMKVLHHDLESDVEVARRFRIEAEAVSRLTHPNTVQVFDFGTARGALYLVMEFIRGRDIGTIIDRDGPMPIERAAPLFGQVAAALAEAHELGVVHRDLKPENILVTRTHGGHDFVKVLDFGLAKLAEREELSESTGRGAIVGTPYYMSPEQIRAEGIDARADIYSLGALMYRVLTGQPPFRAKTPVGVLTKHLTEPLVPPTVRAPELNLPAGLDRIIGKAMEKEPDARYRSIDLLSDAIAELYESVRTGVSSGQVAWHFPSTSSSRANRLAPDIDYGIDSDLRLRRSDLDRYESSLKRRHVLRLLAIPVAAALIGAAVFYYLAYMAGQPITAEAEPNNALGDPNLVALNTDVTGFLGKRISPSEADKDFYQVEIDGTASVSLSVSPLPNLDLSLFVYDLNGRILRYANDSPIGKGESIASLAVDGTFIVVVTEARETGANSLPIENVSDPYRLEIRSTAAEH